MLNVRIVPGVPNINIHMKTRAETVLTTAEDMMSKFLCYDRKEDDQLPVGEIEEAIRSGEVSIEQILDVVRRSLLSAV